MWMSTASTYSVFLKLFVFGMAFLKKLFCEYLWMIGYLDVYLVCKFLMSHMQMTRNSDFFYDHLISIPSLTCIHGHCWTIHNSENENSSSVHQQMNGKEDVVHLFSETLRNICFIILFVCLNVCVYIMYMQEPSVT